MSVLRFLASAVKKTPPRPLCPDYQALVEKVEGLKAAHGHVGSLSKSIQELDSIAKRYRVVWRFNERKIEHGLRRDEPAMRRRYHLAFIVTSVVMYLAPKASKMFR